MRAWYSGCAWVSKTHEKCSIHLARAIKDSDSKFTFVLVRPWLLVRVQLSLIN